MLKQQIVNTIELTDTKALTEASKINNIRLKKFNRKQQQKKELKKLRNMVVTINAPRQLEFDFGDDF